MQDGQERAGLPAHEVVYRALKQRILLGQVRPGDALTLQGLAEDLQVSLTPVREAVRRLIAENALKNHSNRRVSVPEMTAQMLNEIQVARVMLETELAVRALGKLSAAEIEELRRIDLALDQSMEAGDIEAYMRHNHAFHFKIYAASGSEILLPLAESLWVQLSPYMRIVCGRFGTRNLVDQHKQIIQALETGDEGLMRRAIAGDIQQGASFVAEDIG